MLKIYRATQNSDTTEGRGHTLTVGFFLSVEDAVTAVKGRGTMGHGDGEVFEIVVFHSYDEFKRMLAHEVPNARANMSLFPYDYLERKIYGYRKNWLGVFDFGFIDQRDSPKSDPQVQKYIELRDMLREKYKNQINLDEISK